MKPGEAMQEFSVLELCRIKSLKKCVSLIRRATLKVKASRYSPLLASSHHLFNIFLKILGFFFRLSRMNLTNGDNGGTFGAISPSKVFAVLRSHVHMKIENDCWICLFWNSQKWTLFWCQTGVWGGGVDRPFRSGWPAQQRLFVACRRL